MCRSRVRSSAVLDDVDAARPQQREQHVERHTGRTDEMRRIIDHEVQRVIGELVGHDPERSRRLVDPVEGAHRAVVRCDPVLELRAPAGSRSRHGCRPGQDARNATLSPWKIPSSKIRFGSTFSTTFMYCSTIRRGFMMRSSVSSGFMSGPNPRGTESVERDPSRSTPLRSMLPSNVIGHVRCAAAAPSGPGGSLAHLDGTVTTDPSIPPGYEERGDTPGCPPRAEPTAAGGTGTGPLHDRRCGEMSAGGWAMLAAIVVALGVARVRRLRRWCGASATSARAGRSIWQEFGLGIALMVLFFVDLDRARHQPSGRRYTDEQRAHGERTERG